MNPNIIIRPYRRDDRQAVRDICAATCWMGEHRRELIPDDWVWAEYWTRYFIDHEPQHTWVACEDVTAPSWHGRPGHDAKPNGSEEHGRDPHGRDARDTHGQDAHATHGRDARETHGQDAHATERRHAPATGRVVGYLSGTVDEGRFHRYAPRLMPGLVWHVIRNRLMRRRASRRAIVSLVAAMFRHEMRLPASVARDYPATCHINLLPEARGGGVGSRLFQTFLETMRALGVPGVHQQPLSINPPILAVMRKAGLRRVASWPIRAYAHVYNGPIELQTWVLRLGGPAAAIQR